MTPHSQKYVIISWKKSGNEICERFYAWDGAILKFEYVAHFEISNEYCGLNSGPYVLKLILATNIGVI